MLVQLKAAGEQSWCCDQELRNQQFEVTPDCLDSIVSCDDTEHKPNPELLEGNLSRGREYADGWRQCL